MKKFIMIFAFIAGVIATSSVLAKQCDGTKQTTQEVTESECYVHTADGVVTCKD